MDPLPVSSTGTRSHAAAFTALAADLAARGYAVLAASHAVPLELWLLPRHDPGSVLHLRARGTSVVLRRHDARALTTVELRSECDCAEHRSAGAGARTVIAAGSPVLDEVVYDGAARLGWRGYEAGLLGPAAGTPLVGELLARMASTRSRGSDPWENTDPRPFASNLTPVEVGPAQSQRATAAKVTAPWPPVVGGPPPTRSTSPGRGPRRDRAGAA